MEVEGEKPSSLPSNYVSIHQLKERWLQQQQQQKSSSKPEPENPKPKPKPNENAINPTNTQNQRPNFGRVTKEHKLKEVKVDDNGSTSKTLVVDDIKNPYENDATKHNQRPNFGRVTKEHKLKEVKVDDNGSTSKTLVVDDMKNPYENDATKHNQRPKYRPVTNQPKPKVVADDLKNPKIKPKENEATKPKADDDGGSSTKTVVVDVTDNKLNGENETGDSKFKLKKKKKYKKLRNPKVVTDQNQTGAEPEPEAKVVEEKMEKNTEVEMVEEKGKEGRTYGRGNGNSRFGAEPERKMEPEQEAEVVEEKMKKKSYRRRKPADKNPNGAELKPEMEEEVVVEKGKRGLGYGRMNGNSRVVWEQKEKTAPVDGNNGGGGGGGDSVVEEVVKERNVGQGRDRNGGYRREGRDRNGGHGRDKKWVPRGSFGEQQRLIWVKKGESVVPN